MSAPFPNAVVTLPPWLDPTRTEEELRHLLASQARYSRELEDAVVALQFNLEKEAQRAYNAETRLSMLLAKLEKPIAIPSMVQELEQQVHLKDSVIACLQQEIAVERSNIITKTRFNSQEKIDPIAQNLQRAKARADAIAEEYNVHFTKEGFALRGKLAKSGHFGIDRPFTFDGPLPMPENLRKPEAVKLLAFSDVDKALGKVSLE